MTTAVRRLRPPTTAIDAVGWLTLYLVLLFFVPSRFVIGQLGSAGAPSMLFGLGSLALWVFMFVGGLRRPAGSAQPVRIALGVLLLCVGISYVLAMAGPMSADEVSPADVALLTLASWAGTLLLTHDTTFERDRLDTLVWRLAVCGGLIALLGIVQVVTRELWVDQLTIPGLASSPGYDLSGRGGFPRPAGTSIHPIEYGMLLAMLLPLVLHVGFHHVHRGRLVRWLPALAVVAVIPVTSSRSAYLGALLALGVCVIGWATRRRLLAAGVGAAGLLAMLVVTPNLFNATVGLFVGAADDPSVTSRVESLPIAGDFIARSPLFGRGLGTFLPKYRIFDNQYLVLLVTIGIVGTLAFLALGVTTAVVMLRLRWIVADEATRDLALSLAAAVCAGFACLVMFDAFSFPMATGTLFLILGIAGALWKLERGPTAAPFGRRVVRSPR
ncbi:O-antigen ligase family protein [Agrococcus carbonis]|uniref:O-antigen ligase n=1 Tax=Agrococcus carbonis TaxID=684552 RepID=A0A1H1LCI3_9MICO|nr:O-antigen ligase family protein [Agrococcus carbonis]SDR72022.1 O-antigen ligase [Agrococcus carbonis]